MSTHDDHNPAATAAQDQLDAAQIDLRAFINSLTAEELLAELRCAVGRLSELIADQWGSGSPESVTMSAVALGLRRFDLDGSQNVGDDISEEAHLTPAPFPFAVRADPTDRCNTADGGIRRRVDEIHKIVHDYMHAQGGGHE